MSVPLPNQEAEALKSARVIVAIKDRHLKKVGDRVVSPNGRQGTVVEVCPVIRDVRVRFSDDQSRFWFYSPDFLAVRDDV